MYESEDRAFELLKNADLKAFEWLFKKYYRPLCFFANRYCNNLQVAEEIVAETFTILWQRRESIFISSSFKAYIYRSVQNQCINYLRHKKIENAYVRYLLQKSDADEQTFQETQNNSYYNKELREQIQQAIKSLPDKCREIFILSRFEHLTYKQIAARLSISPKTVENQMGIALDKLRKTIRQIFTIFL